MEILDEIKYTVYVLSSLKIKKTYVGFTDNLDRRLEEHNSGKNYYTKRYLPWKVLHSEQYDSEKEAVRRENI